MQGAGGKGPLSMDACAFRKDAKVRNWGWGVGWVTGGPEDGIMQTRDGDLGRKESTIFNGCLWMSMVAERTLRRGEG